MKSIFRSICTKLRFNVRSLNVIPQPQPHHLDPQYVVVYGIKSSSHLRSVAGGEKGIDAPPSLKIQAWYNQVADFNRQIKEYEYFERRMLSIILKIESAAILLKATLSRARYCGSIPDVMEQSKLDITLLREPFNELAEIKKEHPRLYKLYRNDWRTQMQIVVSLLTFRHWLETGSLLLLTEAEKILGLKSSEFGLDIEDYVFGVYRMNDELVYCAQARAKASDYDFPGKVIKLLREDNFEIWQLELISSCEFKGIMDQCQLLETYVWFMKSS